MSWGAAFMPLHLQKSQGIEKFSAVSKATLKRPEGRAPGAHLLTLTTK